MLKDLIKKRRIYKSALARALNRRYETLVDYLKQPSIQISILWEICHVLKHNFFYDIAAQLPADFATNVTKDDTQSLKIAELEQQIIKLTAERDVLLQLNKK
jgi:hypothetical protein